MEAAKVHPNGNHIVDLETLQNETSQLVRTESKSDSVDATGSHFCDEKCDAKYPLHWAARQLDYTMFESMFSEVATGTKPEVDITETDCDGASILIRLIQGRSDDSAVSLKRMEEVVEWFLMCLTKEVRLDSAEKLSHFINIQDRYRKSALNYVADSSIYIHRLVSSLLTYGANPSLTDSRGCTPLHYVVLAPTETDEALLQLSDPLKTAKLLLEAMPTKDILDNEGKSPLEIAMCDGLNVEMAQLLLDYGCSPFPLQIDKDTGHEVKRFILHHAIEECYDENEDNVECIKRLAKVLSKVELNAKYEGKKVPKLKGKTAIHSAALSLCPNLLKELLEVGGVDLFIVDDDGRTALHILANFGWNNGTTACVDILLDTKDKLKFLSESEKIRFFKLADTNGETALDIAIRRDSARLSKTLILNSPYEYPEDWVSLDLMQKIYRKVPESLISVMEQNINFDNKNYEANDETFTAHIGPITGFGCNECTNDKFPEEVSRETDLLAEMIHSRFVSGTELENVLGHPLVQIFIMEKWKKLRMLFWIGLVIKFTWICLYLYFVIDVFWITFPYIGNETTGSSTINEETKYLETVHFVCGIVIVCSTITIFCFKTLVSTMSVGCKKSFRVFSLVHLVFSVSICSTTIILCISGIQPWLYVATAINVTLGSFIGMWELRNVPVIGIYADVFFTATKNLVLLMVAFIPLLLGFTIAISLMLRGNQSFPELHWNVIKTLIMMLGEINFNDLFYGSTYQSPFRPFAILILTLFVICIPIVMFNLLLGFTISDVQALEAESEHKVLISTLDAVILLERVVLSPQIQKVLPKRLLWSFVLAVNKCPSPECEEECLYFGKKLEIRIPMSDLPAKVRDKIRQIAKKQVKQPP